MDEGQLDAIRSLSEALAFIDEARLASHDERMAAGRDPWEWLEAAARKVVAVARESECLGAYTSAELDEFRDLVEAGESLRQTERIRSRLDLPKFIERVGREKCQVMFEALKAEQGP